MGLVLFLGIFHGITDRHRGALMFDLTLNVRAVIGPFRSVIAGEKFEVEGLSVLATQFDLRDRRVIGDIVSPREICQQRDMINFYRRSLEGYPPSRLYGWQTQIVSVEVLAVISRRCRRESICCG